MNPIRIFTIGFTKKTAEEFFTKLREASVKRIVDVRLNNTSQLAGFSKQDDLAYFLRELIGIDYVHVPQLAPTKQILDAYKKHKGPWTDYEEQFFALMRHRCIEETVEKDIFREGCLLCSEHEPERCHRRLVAEYLQQRWDNVEVAHLC